MSAGFGGGPDAREWPFCRCNGKSFLIAVTFAENEIDCTKMSNIFKGLFADSGRR